MWFSANVQAKNDEAIAVDAVVEGVVDVDGVVEAEGAGGAPGVGLDGVMAFRVSLATLETLPLPNLV